MYQYQQTRRFFAQIAHEMEALGAAELTELGAENVEAVYRGLHFDADDAALYRIVYQSRLITRVLAPLLTFDCHSDRYLYRTARDVAWEEFLGNDGTFAVFATVNNSKITHSKFAALRLKDAIADRFRDRTGRRPDVDRRDPDVWFNLHIQHDRATISLDLAGGSLHRRGYRTATLDAPMQEPVAAAVLAHAEWNGETPLYDPMCGSGTLLCEALMRACRIPASYLRTDFGFTHAPDFDAAVWQRIKADADAAIRPLPDDLIAGSDSDPDAVRATRENLANLPHGRGVRVEQRDWNDLDSVENTTLVTNPPYGLRLDRGKDMGPFYRAFGDFLKQRCTGSTAYVYVGEPKWLKKVGLRTSWKKPLVNGALEGRLAKYELY